MINYEGKDSLMGKKQVVLKERIKKSKIKCKIIKGIVMMAAVISMCWGIKSNVLASTPVLKVDGTTVNINAAATGNGSSGGSWSYTPSSGSGAAVLTLNNYQGGGIDYQYAPEAFNVKLVGVNTITAGTGLSGIKYYTDSNYTFTVEGAGSLNIKSERFGIECDDIVGPPFNNPQLSINANLTINSRWSCINLAGLLTINGGTINLYSERSETILVDCLTINGGNITAKSINSAGVRLMNDNQKFEINGGMLNSYGKTGGIDGDNVSFYFNEGSRVIATSASTTGIGGIFTWKGQIYFNGGEVFAQNISERKTAAIRAKKDEKGNAFYFGESQRAMVYFEGSSVNDLQRVNKLDLEKIKSAVHIYPKLKATVKSDQKNATIKLANKTPNYGSGPAQSVNGIRGETIFVSVSCVKDKKIGRLYYYKAGEPGKKVTIDTNKKTFTMPEDDVVVGATIVDKVKVRKITLNKSKLTLRKGKTIGLNATIKPKNADNKGLKWESSNKKIATVSQNGVVKGKKYGTVTISVTAKDGSKKKAGCKVSVGYKIDYKLNGGKNHKSNPSAYYNQIVKLKNPVRADYEFKGWYTNKSMTKEISVIGKGKPKNYTLYAKWKKVKAPAAPKLTRAKNVSGRNIELTFKKVKDAAGYEVSYATNKLFTESVKTIRTTKTSTVLKSLKKGKTYYVKVRAYKKDSANRKVYGGYSRLKKEVVKR